MTGGDTVIVTGATGFLGGYITAALLKSGCRVIVPVRPLGDRSPEIRMAALMDFFQLDPGDRLEVVEAHLERPGLGLENRIASELGARAGHILHCAADTSFAARRRDRVRRVNIAGLVNVFMTFGGDAHFHHMSTAYAAGVRDGNCLEEIRETEEFHNEYERSKFLAEKEITRLCGESGRKLTIYRPSIVYGDSVTGRSLRFNALYQPVRILLLLRDSFLRDLEKNGARASELGVSIDSRGYVDMPMGIPNRGGWMNLIPVDYLVASVLEIMGSGGRGLYHIVNTRENTLDEILEYIRSSFHIRGIRPVPGERPETPSPLEVLMDGYMSVYYPYISDRRKFDASRSREVLEAAGISCPRLDAGNFSRCMDFAVRMRWGAELSV